MGLGTEMTVFRNKMSKPPINKRDFSALSKLCDDDESNAGN